MCLAARLVACTTATFNAFNRVYFFLGSQRRLQGPKRKPVQEQLGEKIRLLESQLNVKLLARRSGLAPEDNEKQISQVCYF